MVKFTIMAGLGAMALGWCSCTADAWGGKDKKDEDKMPEMPKGKDAVDLGRAHFRQVAGDVGLLQDLLKDLEDPEVMKEVEKLMNDKKFKKEVDAMINSGEWETAMGDTMKFFKDPEAMADMKKQAQQYTEFLAKGPGKDGRRDAEMGINAAAMAAMDPNFMKDALEMMKDPAVMRQVEETMKNPEFQRSMKEMMDSPAMKAQLAEAGATMEQLMKDPKLMAEAQRQINDMMAGMRA